MSVMPSLQGFCKNPDGSYSITDKRANYGKVTGTQMSGLLNMNPWQTPFSTVVRMMRLYNEDISDKPSVRAGVVIEPKILDYMGATHGDDIFQKREGDHEAWASDFEDEIFGGHIDGLMPDGTVVEIKTSSRPQDWDGKIPLHYHIQASLYAHFLKSDRILFGVGFMDKDSLANPDKWNPDKDNTIIVEADIIGGFDVMMEDAERIYRETVLSGRTPVPDMSNPADVRIVRYLDAQLWDEDGVDEEIDMIGNLMLTEQKLKAVQDEIEDEKTRLALYMDHNGVTDLEHDGITVIRGTTKRSTVDTNLLKRDGLYDLYLKEKEYRTIKINKRK